MCMFLYRLHMFPAFARPWSWFSLKVALPAIKSSKFAESPRISSTKKSVVLKGTLHEVKLLLVNRHDRSLYILASLPRIPSSLLSHRLHSSPLFCQSHNIVIIARHWQNRLYQLVSQNSIGSNKIQSFRLYISFVPFVNDATFLQRWISLL